MKRIVLLHRPARAPAGRRAGGRAAGPAARHSGRLRAGRVRSPQAEQLPAAPLVIAAYAFVWVALMVYVWSLWRRMAKLERELADLQRRVQQQ